MARRLDYAGVIDAVYAAAVDPDKWPEALDRLRRLCAADSAAINVQHVTDGTGRRVAFGYELGHQPRYFDGYAASNPLFRALLRQPSGIPYPHQVLVDDAAFRRGIYFNQYCRPNELYFMAGLVIARSGDTAEWLTVNRGPRGAAFDLRQLAPLARLAPHLHRASEASRRLTEVRAARVAWEAALDVLQCGLVLLDERGRVVFANQAARRLDSARDGFALHAGGVSASAAAEPLARAVANAASGDSHGVRAGAHIALPRRSAVHPLSAMVIPLPRDLGWQPPGAPAVLLLIADPADSTAPDAAWFVSMFRLTEREAELAALLAAGCRLDDAAAQLGIGRETARTHLARTLSKTGSERQTDLVRLASAMPIGAVRAGGS